MASDVRLGVRSLRDYCQALGLPFKASQGGGFSFGRAEGEACQRTTCSCCFAPQPPVLLSLVACRACQMPESRVPGVAAAPAIAGPIYVKYNSASGLCYATQYEGRDRGVLVQLGQRQLGHLPLGLHDEGMARPPPAAL